MLRPNTTHELKTWPVFFEAVWSGDKTFEIRKNDRGFRVGDWLRLRESSFKGIETVYTGRVLLVEVTYILPATPGLFDLRDLCVMSIRVLGREFSGKPNLTFGKSVSSKKVPTDG